MWPRRRKQPAPTTAPPTPDPAPTTARDLIPSEVVQDVWTVLIDTFRRSHGPPTLADLEAVYKESELVQAVLFELIQAISTCDVSASLAMRTLLEHPNPVQDFSQFMTSCLIAYVTTGRLYVLKLPIGSKATQQLNVLRSSAVTITQGTFEDPYRSIAYADGRNTYPQLSPDDVIARVSPSAEDALAPASSIEASWDSIQLDLARIRFQRAALLRLPFLVGVCETTHASIKGQRDELQSSLSSIMGGQTVVLPEGAKLTTPGLGQDSITLPGLAQQCESRVCATNNVPAILVGFQAGLDKSTYSNYEEARRSYHDETIRPLLLQLSDTFSRGLNDEVVFSISTPSADAGREGDDYVAEATD